MPSPLRTMIAPLRLAERLSDLHADVRHALDTHAALLTRAERRDYTRVAELLRDAQRLCLLLDNRHKETS